MPINPGIAGDLWPGAARDAFLSPVQAHTLRFAHRPKRTMMSLRDGRGLHAWYGAVARRLVLAGVCAGLLPLAGCPYYYQPPPATEVMQPASFDRSFAAAAGAMRDEGLTITVQDPGTGAIAGTIDGSTVTADVRQQG
jgi:hypothetical protein